ncbi:hypothetical protein [Weissella paramesenteroides]|nr:hypothetical protein [Weissella paramesenteroides]
MRNDKKQPLFKSTAKNVETRSMPKNKSAETPEDYASLLDKLAEKNKK